MNFSSAKLWRDGTELTAEAAGSCEMTPGQAAVCCVTLEVPKKDHAWFKVINGVGSRDAAFILHISDDTILEIVGDSAGMPVDRGQAGRLKFKGVRQLDREEFARECGGPAD
jgi:hypothetical protein